MSDAYTLHAIVQVHYPEEGWFDDQICHDCSNDSMQISYPCPVVEAVTRGLTLVT